MIKDSKFKIKNSRKGFTLIELLVVMAIIGILAATVLVNFGRNDDRDVRAERDKLTSFLREVQNKSLAGETGGISVSGRICGFGVRQAGTKNLESFYAYVSDINGDCGANWNNNTIAYETFYPSNGTAFSLTGSVFFLIPNGAVVCDGCSLPEPISITKNGLTVHAAIDSAGNIYNKD